MTDTLRQIYRDVAAGTLSQHDALEQIKAAKRQRREQGSGLLLAAPVWQDSDLETESVQIDYAEHHILLCELSSVNVNRLGTLVPRSLCRSLNAGWPKNIAERYTYHAIESFECLKAILQEKSHGNVLVQIVVADDEEHAHLAGLSALLTTATLENPQIAGQLILVSDDILTAELARHLLAEKTRGRDALVTYADGARRVRRWQDVTADPQGPPIAFDDCGVYLITGGLGALGVLFAKEILEQTRDARVVLAGRSAPGAAQQASWDSVSAQAGRVSYRQVDIGDLDQVTALIAAIEKDHGRLTGILHGAGMIADNFILKKPAAEFRQVLAPKVTGTYNLDQGSRHVELDFFVLFSSLAAAMGNVGQADYATANAFLDQFATHRNAQVAAKQRHGRTRSIDWPLWQAGGMRLDPATQALLQQTTGVQSMPTATGLRAFYRSLALPYGQTLVMEGDLAQMRRVVLDGPTASPAPQAERPAAATAIEANGLIDKAQDYFRKQFAGLLKLPSHTIDPDAAMEQYGIDSILAMKLTSQLEETFGSLSKTLFFEYQTIGELTTYFTQAHAARLATLLGAPGSVSGSGTGTGTGNGTGTSNGRSATTPVATRPAPPADARRVERQAPRRVARPRTSPGPTTDADPIAIIGLSGRYPEAADLDAYWNNLRDGKDCIVEVPKERWDWRQYYSEDRTQSGRHYSKWGGFIPGVDEFDPLFFNISPRDAKYIDPQERLFLQHAWMAIEDAGYTRASLQMPDARDMPGQVGVYAGLMYSEYQLFGAEASAHGQPLAIAGSAASVANRVSYVLNLHGPSMTLDTMCSSSLTAIHVACQDLREGRTSLAIAGGVNVSIHPNKYLLLSAGQFISSDGHCQSFGEGGDGYIPGEGVGVVILKRLADAQRDGDHIYGLIRGSALNHGGKTNGYTVPNPHAQASAIGRALAESHVDARQLSYLEAHGTGTRLGDPIEIAALSAAFQPYTQDTGFCCIGSVKSNIGHCESAAGIAGLTKVLLQLQHQQIVPSLHSSQLNPHIDFPSSPFVVNQTLRPWVPPMIDGRTLPRIAGLSSFGAGGSNAHVIIEEYQPPASQSQPMAFTHAVILLSARTAAQLQQKAQDLLLFIESRLTTVDLTAMAYTLQVGREAMDERLGVVVSTVAQLVETLQAYVAGEREIDDLYQGQVKRHKDAMSVFNADADMQHTIEKWIASGKLARLVDLWVKGLEVDWSKLYDGGKPARISLPAYPFAKERHWIDPPVNPVTVASPAQGVATTGAAAGAAATGAATGAATRAVTGAATSDAPGTVAAVIHPLLHVNASTLSEQRYRSTFTGEEFFLADHEVRASDGSVSRRRMLPAAVYLEMARAAIADAVPARSDTAACELRDVVWAQPLLVSASTHVGIALIAHDPDHIDFEIYSQDAEQEIVRCQGRAVVGRHQAAPARLDLEQLAAMHQGRDQVLTQLWLPLPLARTEEDTSADYVLHPSVMESALQACVALMDGAPTRAGQPRQFVALDSLHIIAACPREMAAWVRYSPGSQAADTLVKLDIDLCDAQGDIAVQLRGASWRPASLDVAAVLSAERREIAFVVYTSVATALPGKIVLPDKIRLSERARGWTFASRPPITLASVSRSARASQTQSAAPAESRVRLYDDGRGIFSIDIDIGTDIAHVRQALDRLRQEPSVKVLLLNGIAHAFGRGGRDAYNEAVAHQLYQGLASWPYPIVAALPGDLIGAGFLAAALCDFMVCSDDATYGYTDAPRGLYPTAPEAALFIERFGDARAQDLLYVSTAATGRQLRAKGWTCPIVPTAQVEAHARELATTLAGKSQEALGLLKQHLTRHLASLTDALTHVDITSLAPDAPSASVSAISAATLASPTATLSLDAPVAHAHVLVITLHVAHTQTGLSDVVAGLAAALARIPQDGSCKAVVLASGSREFLPGASHTVSEADVLDLQRAVAESPIPVIAALDGNAHGLAWLIAQFCDACVYSRTGVYSCRTSGQTPALARAAVAVFTHRFGNEAGREILLTGAEYLGTDLQQRIGPLLVTAREEVLPTAIEVAASWTTLPRATLAAWKQQAAITLREKIQSLPLAAREPDDIDDGSDLHPTSPIAIPLRSPVVTAVAHADGIVVVTLEDRQAKNMFSPAFIEGVTEVFAYIAQAPVYKAVVLTGYDTYFASGGTKESLLAVQSGAATFNDVSMFHAALDCKLPVIAAMQGHGIGAGWSLGMFADVVVLSDESRYVSPYMDYGFTPGAGATWILADRIGHDLARESLLTAQPFTGRALKGRGLTVRILPRAEVYPAAMALARQIARSSRRRVISLKQQLTAYAHQPLEDTYRRELAMHERTFVGRPDTLALIHKGFSQEHDASPVPTPAPRVARVMSPVVGDALPAVTATLKALLANELLMQQSDIDDDAKFVDLGLDSIGGVTWIRKINEQYRTSIDPTTVYSYPTLAEFSRYVKDEAQGQGTLPAPVASATFGIPISETETPIADRPNGDMSIGDMSIVELPHAIRPPVPAPAPNPLNATPRAVATLASWRGRAATRFAAGAPAPRHAEPIAVIGMAGQFPRARNLDEFWDNIAQGRNCITQVSPDRWDVNTHYQPGDPVAGKTNSHWLGALDDYDLFDPLFFNISPTEAEHMDPQQRVFLQACWHSLEHAGYDARALSGSKCGVFVGCAAGDYHQASRTHQLSAHGFTGSASSILAARISYFLNLQGPCVSIDTACSSSLVAIAQACDSLTAGVSNLALAAGVYVMAGPEMHIRAAQAGMLSPQGHCFTFDQRADGFVVGEGVGVVVLKRLADAERDRDTIYGLVQAWGVNQDGKTNGITAPSPDAQTRLEQEVYDRYGIDPSNIQLLEAHGTGTKLGDPIEVAGLKHAFRTYTRDTAFCALGSVKSNIGHCLTAAGVAGAIKLLLALRHQQLPPTINFERLNEHIDLADTPFYVNSCLQAWTRRGTAPRQAAVSSFGFSGTNAHLVIGEYVPPAEVTPRTASGPRQTEVIIPLSARTAPQLDQKVRDLLAFVRKTPSIDLIAMACTLQTGRAAMEERLGVVVGSVEQLAERLEAYVAGEAVIDGMCRGQAKRTDALSLFGTDGDLRHTVDTWIADRKLAKLLDLWVKGLDVEWRQLYGEVTPQRLALPMYPFAKERYWIEAPALPQAAARGASAPAAAAAMAVIHPLLHGNASDLREQRYRSTFAGDEWFLADHGANGAAEQKVLPALAHLEMARAAIAHASPAGAEPTVLELRDTVWGPPMVVDEHTTVTIALAAADTDTIDYDIFSESANQTIVYCQGRAVSTHAPAVAALDLDRLERHVGRDQLLVRLPSPPTATDMAADFVLHPSVLDRALQAVIGWLDGPSPSSGSRVPSALDVLRIVSPCPEELIAWGRYSPGSDATDALARLDLDLCDVRGRVCVQMHGLSLRALGHDIAPPAATQGQAIGALLAVPIWEESGVDASAEWPRVDYTEHHAILCGLSKVKLNDLVSLLPHCQCLALHAEDRQSPAQQYGEYALACFERIQGILGAKPQGPVVVQCVVADDQAHALFAGLSGLLKTAALEHPRLTGQLILTAPHTTTDALARCLQDERTHGQDPIVKYEHGARHVWRWQEVAETQERPPIAFKDDGVYLITGGFGGLGMLFAQEIVARTRYATVILTGRSPLSTEKQIRLDALSARAGQLHYRQVDLDDLDQVTQLVAAIHDEHGHLHGILHSAGMLADDFIARKSSAQFRDVLAPKVTGTYNLDQASQGVDLDFFVLFSSIAGPLGNPGQADYATANAFMDWFAAYRNRQVAAGRRHGRTRSINWGLWQAGGMGIDAASQELLLQTTGMRPMQTATALDAFHRSLMLPYDQMLVVEGLQPQIRAYLRQARLFAPPSSADAAAPYRYANKAEEFYADTTSRASAAFKEEYLTFAPFAEKRPGFSMSRVLLAPDLYPDDAREVLARQIEMRQVLFGKEDFGKLTSVLDFGCGHGTDVIQIGASFPHIQAHGCTITRDQATLGNQRIAGRHLDASRIQIYHQDSSRDPFPSQYDLVFGIEVSFHIRNKTALFTNICRSLTEHGRLLLADYVSNIQGSVDDPNIEISIPSVKQWARLTSQCHLEIDDVIDVSPEIANFLYDPEVQENVGALPTVSQRTLRSYANQSASLERGWLSYVLLRLTRNTQRSPEQIERHNLDKLEHPTPYPVALQAMLRQPHVDYPSRNRPSPAHIAADADHVPQQITIMLAAVLRMDASAIDADKPFVEFGLDSFLGVELTIAINKKYGTELSNMVLFDHPTVNELARCVEREVERLPGASIPRPPAPASPPSVSAATAYPTLKRMVRGGRQTGSPPAAADDKIAIIGMSGRYPEAGDLAQYWTNLVEGRNCIGEVPCSRWDVHRFYDPEPAKKGKTNSRWLGALDDIDCFDPLFFRISPHEAESIDPQHRLFLQESYRAFEDAGYSIATLGHRKCGVYLGMSTNDYEVLLDRHHVLPTSVTGNSHAIAAARIAYYLNLKGPAISVDTACSSSLVATHLACQGLLNGDADMALAGGVTLWLLPESYLAMSQAGMLSPMGQCKAFDDAADGIVVGEGVGVLVLKRLKDAEADGDVIHGVILGSGINQDGKTNGITAPSVNSQIELERGIYARYKIDPESISYVETHGTGTKLGDPIELEALSTVFKEKTAKRNFCALGSVKSNIGHTTAAAGVAGVHKVLLSMRHRTLVPTLHVTRENSRFDFKSSPFYISRSTTAWESASGAPRRAAISSFGFSGTNAHLVIEEYPSASRPVEPAGEDARFVVPLSARTAEQLRQRARDLLACISPSPRGDQAGGFAAAVSTQSLDLAAIAFTLQTGREAMDERLGFVVRSLGDLADKLRAYLNGDKHIEDTWCGRVDPNSDGVAIIGRDEDMLEAIEKWLARRKYSKLLELWTRGLSIDWRALHGDRTPRRVSLPTYPFAKEHYWVESETVAHDAGQRAAVNIDMTSIEDIINKIADGDVEADEAVKALKVLV
jgi:acyl transferase domain-containing protein/enoyl-CoA hydratase/carnithine racemase/acyl carrier protein